MSRLIASGALSWGGGKPHLERPLKLSTPGTSISRTVLEDRYARSASNALHFVTRGKRASV